MISILSSGDGTMQLSAFRASLDGEGWLYLGRVTVTSKAAEG